MKANEINGVDTTSFLKNFVVLMYLFKFDFFKTILIKKTNPIAVKKSIEHRKIFSENFLMPPTFCFLEIAVFACFCS